jgi:hypothetical protein
MLLVHFIPSSKSDFEDQVIFLKLITDVVSGVDLVVIFAWGSEGAVTKCSLKLVKPAVMNINKYL